MGIHEKSFKWPLLLCYCSHLPFKQAPVQPFILADTPVQPSTLSNTPLCSHLLPAKHAPVQTSTLPNTPPCSRAAIYAVQHAPVQPSTVSDTPLRCLCLQTTPEA